MTAIPSAAPIFIVGAGRSGTTLIRSLFSAHSRIAVTPETHFLKLAQQHGGLRHGVPADCDEFWRALSGNHRFKDLGVDPEYCRSLVGRLGKPTMENVFRAMLAAYGERCGKPRVGEKTPGHVKFMPELLECFPETRIIVLRRDPRAVVASQLKTPWARSQSLSLRNGLLTGTRLHQVAFFAWNWRKIYETIVPQFEADPRITILSYESLVHDPEAELRRICAFVGESYEATMLTGRSRDTVPQPAATGDMSKDWRDWSLVHNDKTLAPISTASLDAWKAELGGAEVALIEGCCSKGMRDAGYSPAASRLRRGVGHLGVPLVRAVEKMEARARNGLQRLSRSAA